MISLKWLHLALVLECPAFTGFVLLPAGYRDSFNRMHKFQKDYIQAKTEDYHPGTGY
jgi:hypothetical protein